MSQSELQAQEYPDAGPLSSRFRAIGAWFLRHYLPLGSLAAVLVTTFYGLAYARIYDSLGVTPEEVGFTPALTLTHAAVGSLALLLLASLFFFFVFIPVVPLGDDRNARTENGTWRQVLANAVLTSLGLGGVYLVSALAGVAWVTPVLAPSTVLLFLLTSFRLSPRPRESGLVGLRPLRFHLPRYGVMFLVLALPLGVLVTGVFTFYAADRVGDAIEEGESLLGVEFGGFPFLEVGAEPAVVSWLGKPADVALPRCLLHLGDAHGESVFYDARSENSYRIPASKIVIRQPLHHWRCTHR